MCKINYRDQNRFCTRLYVYFCCKVGIFNIGIYGRWHMLLEPTSSGHSRNCNCFWHLHVGFIFEPRRLPLGYPANLTKPAPWDRALGFLINLTTFQSDLSVIMALNHNSTPWILNWLNWVCQQSTSCLLVLGCCVIKKNPACSSTVCSFC